MACAQRQSRDDLNFVRRTASEPSMKLKLLAVYLGLALALVRAEPKNEFQALYGSNGSLCDASGRSAFSARSSGTSTTYRDASGRVTVTASGFSADRLTYRDSSGRVCGTASQTGTRTTFRDGSGRITGTASQTGDRTTYRDASGRIVGTASRSGDTITFRDGSGRTTGTASVRK
jgi:YD repeat-containing protein